MTFARKAVLAALLLLTTGGAGMAAEEGGLETAIFAGGCFWCVESDFDVVPGVVGTVSGYIGGTTDNPTYQQVGRGDTGHYEAVEITFDPAQVTYEELLHIFWRSIDPTDDGGQFCDRGSTYLTAVFATSDEQRLAAEASKEALVAANALDDPIVTPVLEAATFYRAEDYHQDYHTTNPVRYQWYRLACGRDKRVRDLWGDAAWGGQGHGES